MDSLSYSGEVPLNKLCGMAEMRNLAWRRALRDLDVYRKGAPFHRKAWEFAHAVYGLRKLERLAPNAVALGVGSGHEMILYFLANKVAKVVATDLYEGSFAEREGSPHMLHCPEMFAPFHYRKDHLEVLATDARKLDFPSGTFDFVFSFSAIEHFGARRDAVTALREMLRVLKPGGIAVITTELILNRLGKTRGFFRRSEIEDVFVASTGFEIVGGNVDYRIERRFVRGAVEFPQGKLGEPCIVLRKGLMLFTSIILFLQKPVGASSGRAVAVTGTEKFYRVRRCVHKAEIVSSVTRMSAKKGALMRVPLRVRNAGDVTWYNYPCETHTVRPGAHLLDASGELLSRDFARGDLPVSVGPGEDIRVVLLARAPRQRGDFLVEVDLVKEGVLWFAEEGSQTLQIPLRVE